MSYSDNSLSNIDSNDSYDEYNNLSNINHSVNDYINDYINQNDSHSHSTQNTENKHQKSKKTTIKSNRLHNEINQLNQLNQLNEFNEFNEFNELNEIKKNKREINYNATLAAVYERQERLKKIKAKIELNSKNENNRLKLIGGLELLYNIVKKQNIKLVDKLQKEFTTSLPFNINLQTTIIKPPYLTPKIVSHRMEKLLNEN